MNGLPDWSKELVMLFNIDKWNVLSDGRHTPKVFTQKVTVRGHATSENELNVHVSSDLQPRHHWIIARNRAKVAMKFIYRSHITRVAKIS